MAEPFAKPNKEQLKKALLLYGDSLMCFAVNTTIHWLNEISKEKDLTSNYWKEFYKMARLMIMNYSAGTTFALVELAVEDLANETWLREKFIPPETKKTKQDREPISREWKSG